MKIPSGMTEESVVALITKIAKRLAPKYVFGFFEKEDLEQEAIIMGLDALDRYDEARPLENFLSVHISNRLKSFLRDNYYRQVSISVDDEKYSDGLRRIEAQKNIMSPMDISDVCDGNEESMRYKDQMFRGLEIKEINKLINEGLPLEYRIDFRKMCDGVSIPKPRKDKIREHIEEILYDYFEEE